MKILLFAFILFPVFAFGQLDTINVGTAPGAGDGEPARDAFLKTNASIKQVNTNTTSIGDTSLIQEPLKSVDTLLMNLTGIFGLPRFTANPAAYVVGQLYYNTVSNEVRVWNGSTWVSL